MEIFIVWIVFQIKFYFLEIGQQGKYNNQHQYRSSADFILFNITILILSATIRINYIKRMSFNNNSRNISNLLKFEPLQPLKPTNQLRNPSVQNLSRERQQIPIHDVFTPDDNISEKRNSRRIAPLSSGGVNRNDNGIRLSNQNTGQHQFEGLKIRLDQIVKYYDQRHTNLQSKMMVRLNELENFVMREVPKIDNSIMVSSDIAGFKQALKDVRKQQEYQMNEISTLKVATRDKGNSEIALAQNTKDKQKMTVLFMQMVRLGDTIEKITDQANITGRNYEAKIQDLQQKLINSQKNLSIISQRTSSGSDVLSQFGDKIMGRLQSAESNLLILGKQQIKDKEVMNKIVSQNQRIGEDLNTMITNMQTDFQNKLENRMNQTLNRLMNEHEERIRAQQDIRKNLDIMDRISQEKQQSDKLQHKARLENMDSAVRNQFLKKEESIKSLQSSMEQQFRTIIGEIQNEGMKRKDQQSMFRHELKKVQESFRKQYDLYKNHQGDLVEKITDMIKAEIQVRVSSQLDLKKLTQDIAGAIVTDLNNVKQAISTSNKKLNLAMKQISNQSAERSGQLSHYIDQEVKKVVDVVTEKYSKMKNVFTKLAEQFKNHLVNTETNRKNHEGRLSAVQEDFEKLKSEVNTQIDEFYNDLQARLKEEKEFVETVVFKKNNDLTLRVNKLEQYTNQYFEVLKTGIQDNKELLNNKAKYGGQGKGKSEESEEQIKQLRTVIFDIKNITQEMKTQNTASYRKLDGEIQQLEAKTKQTILQLGNSLNGKIGKNQQKITQVQTNLAQITTKVNGIRAESGSENAISTDRLKKMSDELNNLTDKVKDLDEKIQNQSDKNDQELIKVRSDITVLKGEVGALDDDIKKLSSS